MAKLNEMTIMKNQINVVAATALIRLLVFVCTLFSFGARSAYAGDPPASEFFARVSPASGLDALGIRIVNSSDDGQSATIIADEQWSEELPNRGYSLDIIKWYGVRSPALQRATKGSTLANASVSLTVDSSGAFTMQRSSDSKWILYPIPTTTAFSVRVDGNVYWTRNGSLTVTTPLTVVNSTTAFIEFTTPQNVVVRQTFDLAGDAIMFTVQARNTDAISHTVQVRYLFDTQVGVNDGSPLYAQGVTDSQNSPVCTYETDIPNVGFSSWRGYDIWPNPRLTSFGTISTTPNRMIFAWWPAAIGYAWDYTPNPYQRFYTPGYTSSPNSDSCVLMYFDLGVLVAGNTKSVSTFYGIGAGSAADPLQDFSRAIDELRSRYLSWSEKKVEIAAAAFAKGIVALRKGETDDIKRSFIGLVTAAASIWRDVTERASLVKKLADAGFKLTEDAKTAVNVLDSTSELFDFTDFAYAVVGVFSPRSLTESHVGWLAEHKDELLSNWDVQKISQEYKRFLWEEIPWADDLSSKGFKTLCETICNTTLSSLKESVTSNNGADYPLSAAASKLRTIAHNYGDDRTLAVWMNDTGAVEELSNDGDWVAALDHAIESFNSAQHTAWTSTWISLAELGVKVVLGCFSAGWATVLEVIVTAEGVAHSLADWTVIDSRLNTAEDKLGNQVGMTTLVAESQVRNGGQVLNLSSKYLDYANHQSLMSSIGVDNTGVSLISLNIPNKTLSRNESQYNINGRNLVVVSNAAANQVPIQAYVPVYAKHSDGSWTLVNYGFTAVESVPSLATYSPYVKDLRLPPQEDLNAEMYVAFGYVGAGPAIKARVVGGMYTSFTVKQAKKASWWGNFVDGAVSLFHSETANTGSQNTYSFTPRQDMVFSDIVLEWPGSDLDLHVYDNHGNHVGLNYATGLVETNIPGATYSGPSAKPEWIRLPNGVVSACQLVVVGSETQEGGEPYNLMVFETPPRQAVLNVSPQKLTNSFDALLTTRALIALRVSEMGGQQMLENLSAQTTGLLSTNGSIPADAIKMQFSSNRVSAGGTEILTMIIEGIGQYQSGVYTGQVTVTASSGEPSAQAVRGGWRGTRGGSMQQVVDLSIEIKRGDIVVDVTSNVSTIFNSWTLDRASGALIASITITNDSGKNGLPLEKVFWYAITESTNVRLATVSGYTNGMAYYDVTAQIVAQLQTNGNRDLKLDVGESVTFTVPIYSRERTIPVGHLYSIWADPVAVAIAVPPKLTVSRSSGGELLLAWPVSQAEYVVEESDSFSQSNWKILSISPTLQGQQYTVTVPIGNGAKLYRLKRK